MIPVVTPSEMAAIDAGAPEPVEVLIERAGAAVARYALDLLGGAYGRRVVVVAGKGNNGNDGRAAAARLTRRGVRVTIVDAADAPVRLPGADLVIDAAYGTGFHGEYEAPDPAGAPVLAVDIPSGVDGLTGEARGRPLAAAATVTFAALKPGLLLHPGRALVGEVTVVDIGLDCSAATAGLVEVDDVTAWIPVRPADSHKWRAAVLVLAGSPGMTGAGHLVAAAAQRAGAGMVRLLVPGVRHDPGRPTEAVGLEAPQHGWAPAAVEAAERAGAIVVGPGLGTSDATAGDARRVVEEVDRPLVVDGDGLTAIGADAPSLVRRRAGVTVLTPHDREAERIGGRRPGADRLDEARRLAAHTGAVVLLKGPTTIVAEPGGEARVVTTGDARLATAGTGDVLAGVIGALLARGAAPLEAAAAGAWLHGRAAALGPPTGLIASDLVDLLPTALAEAGR